MKYPEIIAAVRESNEAFNDEINFREQHEDVNQLLRSIRNTLRLMTLIALGFAAYFATFVTQGVVR